MASSRSRALRETERAVRHPARKARRDAERGRGWYSFVARAGLVAKGVSFGIVGALAALLALGEGGTATSREGALASIADEPLGNMLLAALALGFASYALWRFVQAFAEREEDDDAEGKAKTWGKRAGYVGRGLIYGGLTYTAVKLLTGDGSRESQNERARETTATVFDLPAGRLLVAAVGLAIVGVGLWNLYRALSTTFEDKWRMGEMTAAERRWGKRVGVAGHLARGAVFGLIGLFLAKAAWEHDARDAIGIDGALQKVANASYGPYLLGVTAVGLLCYGIYCLVDARYRDVSANAGGV